MPSSGFEPVTPWSEIQQVTSQHAPWVGSNQQPSDQNATSGLLRLPPTFHVGQILCDIDVPL